MTHFTMKDNGKTRHFLYSFEKALVYYVQPTTEEEKEDNKEWFKKYNNPLWDTITVDEIEYTVIDGGVGLRRENWNNKEVREEYLTEWLFEIYQEIEYLI